MDFVFSEYFLLADFSLQIVVSQTFLITCVFLDFFLLLFLKIVFDVFFYKFYLFIYCSSLSSRQRSSTSKEGIPEILKGYFTLVSRFFLFLVMNWFDSGNLFCFSFPTFYFIYFFKYFFSKHFANCPVILKFLIFLLLSFTFFLSYFVFFCSFPLPIVNKLSFLTFIKIISNYNYKFF